MDEQQEVKGLQEQTGKKNGKWANGTIGKGILIGVLLAVLCGSLGIYLVCLLTGSQIVITRGVKAAGEEGAVLDADSVAKINELAAYINLYYYDETDTEALKSGMYAGLLSGVNDKYSTYYTAEEYEQSQIGMTGKYFLAVLCGSLGIYLVCLLTGSQIVITRGVKAAGEEGAVLDADSVAKINELAAYINLYYYDETDTEALKSGMYAGLLSGVNDKYSTYYTAEEYEQSQIGMTGKYYGIGAGLTQDIKTMVVTVNKIYDGTPSKDAGLLKDDVILSVEDVEATSMELSELVQLIRGEEGTTVHLEVYRPATGENLSFDVERANVTLPSVASEMLTEEIGYIRIESFETDTAAQFETALAQLENSGMHSLVIDLRYNGGGLVDSVVQILDDILPEGLLVYTEDKYGNRQEYKSSGETHFDYPLAVLVNEDSASASEIFAGAIKDYEYGTLIGTKTFGKGIG